MQDLVTYDCHIAYCLQYLGKELTHTCTSHGETQRQHEWMHKLKSADCSPWKLEYQRPLKYERMQGIAQDMTWNAFYPHDSKMYCMYRFCTACTSMQYRSLDLDRGYCQLSVAIFMKASNKGWSQKLTKWLLF